MNCLKIAILTHNALAYTKMCLASIRNYTSIHHEIYIYDNASTDGSLEWLLNHKASNWFIFHSGTNLGVAGGRNTLIKCIVKTLADEDLVVFLDNDVEVHAGWFSPFLKLFELNCRVGVAGAMGHKIIVHDNWRELLPPPEGDPAPVDVVSGFCFWVRSETVHAVGLFDENLGMFWHEDDDYCIRAIHIGLEVFAVPGTQIVHYGHKSGFTDEGFSSQDSLDNQCYLSAKWRKLGVVDSEGKIIRRY